VTAEPASKFAGYRFLSWAILARLLASALAYARGFRAISDDDYSRVVIAQRFAENPSLDPSGTSWLPAPFWLAGAMHALFGSDLVVARLGALILSCAGTALLYPTARMLGLERRAAIVATFAGAVLPHAVWMGMATVPDGLTAVLVVFFIACAASRSAQSRLWGGFAVCFSTLSRYETWPLALGFFALTLYDLLARRLSGRLFTAWLGLGLALAGPTAWLAHGVVHHGDAFFFIARVVEYQRRLDRAFDAMAYLRLLFTAEPELLVSLGLALYFVWRLGRKAVFHGDTARKSPPATRREGLSVRFRVPFVFFGALLGFLCLGAARGGAPTHHLERPLLSIWLFGCVVLGDAIVVLEQRLGRRPLVRFAIALVAVAIPMRYFFTVHEGFVVRRDEEALGAELRALASSSEARFWIDTGDYGYFAVMAASGASSQAEAAELHPGMGATSARPPSVKTRFVVTSLEKKHTYPDHKERRRIGRLVLMSPSSN
jgi:4-amino-4-deoxy-L-arabinose transferase-like glycosyltransferase